MAPKQEVEFLDGIVRATFVSRQEAASVLQAQLLLCQLVTHQEDPLSGCFVAFHSSSSKLKLWQVAKSSPKTTAAGARSADMLQHCQLVHSTQQQRCKPHRSALKDKPFIACALLQGCWMWRGHCYTARTALAMCRRSACHLQLTCCHLLRVRILQQQSTSARPAGAVQCSNCTHQQQAGTSALRSRCASRGETAAIVFVSQPA